MGTGTLVPELSLRPYSRAKSSLPQGLPPPETHPQKRSLVGGQAAPGRGHPELDRHLPLPLYALTSMHSTPREGSAKEEPWVWRGGVSPTCQVPGRWRSGPPVPPSLLCNQPQARLSPQVSRLTLAASSRKERPARWWPSSSFVSFSGPESHIPHLVTLNSGCSCPGECSDSGHFSSFSLTIW